PEVVHPDGAVAEPVGDPLRTAGVRRPHAARETVDRVVADADGVVLVGEPLDRHHGPERLLLDAAHRGVAAREDGRQVEEAGLEVGIVGDPAAGHDLRALGHGPGDVRLDLGQVTGGSPTAAPVPVTRLATPGGRPASSSSRSRWIVVEGVSSLGLITNVLPAASAGATFHDAWSSG